MQGHATRARNIVGPGVVGYTELEAIPYDPAKAKELLAQAGVPNGFNTTMTCAPSDELDLPGGRAGPGGGGDQREAPDPQSG